MAFGAFFFLNPQLSAKEKRYSSIIIAVRPSSMNGTRAIYEVFQNKCFTMEICWWSRTSAHIANRFAMCLCC